MQQQDQQSSFDGIVIALGALALLGLVFAVSPVLSPFFIVLVLFFSLFPLREYRPARVIMFTAGVLFTLWFFIVTIEVLFPFILGLVLAYLFNPLVTLLQKKKIARVWSSLVIVLLFCTTIGVAIYLLAPVVISQFQALVTNISNYLDGSTLTLDEAGIRNFFLSLGIPKKYVDQYVTGHLVPELRRLFSQAPSFAVDILAKLPGFLEKMINIILIPVSFFYFLMEWDLMTDNFIELIPLKRRPHWQQVFRNIDRVLYGYIRGQSTVALIIGTLGGLSFWVLGIPYAGLLAVFIALLDLIPFLGLILSLTIVEAVIIISMPMTFGNMITGPIVILCLHLIEIYAIGPRIVGKGVGIPAILIILSIFVFGYFLGFWGMLIAVPATGVMLLFVREYRQAVSTQLE